MNALQIARRTHLYAALFLAPWLLMYTLSTLVMNHRAIFVEKYGRGPPPFVVERELVYAADFPADATPREMARRILVSLDLDGAHTVNRQADGTLVINRTSLTTPRRITYSPNPGRVVIEKSEARANAFLERFHRRRGYATGYALDTVWAVTVDVFIAAMIIWAVSGVWMWWELKVTRRIGAIALFGGAALFTLFLLTI